GDDVARDRGDARARVRREPRVGALLQEGDEARQAHETLARLRDEVAALPDLLQLALKVVALAAGRGARQDAERDRVEVGADLLEYVGEAVDDRLEQAGEQQ